MFQTINQSISLTIINHYQPLLTTIIHPSVSMGLTTILHHDVQLPSARCHDGGPLLCSFDAILGQHLPNGAVAMMGFFSWEDHDLSDDKYGGNMANKSWFFCWDIFWTHN